MRLASMLSAWTKHFKAYNVALFLSVVRKSIRFLYTSALKKFFIYVKR
jgi:hypothetical protein